MHITHNDQIGVIYLPVYRGTERVNNNLHIVTRGKIMKLETQINTLGQQREWDFGFRFSIRFLWKWK